MDPTVEDRCFVDELLEPARFLDIIRVPSDASNHSAVRSQSFSNLESLRAYVENDENGDYSCRFISICQRNSWRPLQITRPMMSLIAKAHDLSHSVWDLPSCFYTRSLDLEEAYCVPLTLFTTGSWIEVSYTIRYPEFKESDKEWVIRQSGICHRFNTETRQSVFLLFSPKPDSNGHRRIEEYLLSWNQGGPSPGPLSLHEALFSAYLPSWRRYLATYEGEFLPLANSTFATYIDEPLRLGYDHLSAMISLETRFVKATSLIESTMDALRDLTTLLSNYPGLSAMSEESDRAAIKLNNHLRQCAAHSRTATYLQRRAQKAGQLLVNTLLFRDQVIAKQQNGNMLQLNKSAVFITMLTLIYAPASFAASFFGMNFFSMDQPNSRIVCTSMIWIYLVSTAVLTGVTIAFYYWLLKHDSLLLWRLAPNVKINPDWRALARRFAKSDQTIDLRDMSRSV